MTLIEKFLESINDETKNNEFENLLFSPLPDASLAGCFPLEEDRILPETRRIFEQICGLTHNEVNSYDKKQRFRELNKQEVHINKSDGISTIFNLWKEFVVLLSDVGNTASMDRLTEAYSLRESNGYDYISWSDLIKQIQAYRNKLRYCIENDLSKLIYEKTERLYSLSDGREQSKTSLKALVEDLKNTERRSSRYNNLNFSIVTLFNSLNDLLTEVDRILSDDGQKITTKTYDLSPLSKSDIGLQ